MVCGRNDALGLFLPEIPEGFEISVAFLENILYNTTVIRVWPSW